MMRTRACWPVIFLFSFTAFAQTAPFPLDADGWSILTPSGDGRTVYVSFSQGSDFFSGLDPNFPVQTLAKGVSLVRSNYPDRLLLKSGDVWNADFGTWTKSGRSATEPMVIGAYGDPADGRPLLLTGVTTAIRTLGAGVNYLAVVGIHFYAQNSNGLTTGAGMIMLGPTNTLLVEDCVFQNYSVNLVWQEFFGDLENMTLRRSIIIDAFNRVGHSQGLFCKGIDGLLIEENVFDHNGWNSAYLGAEKTIFNHNIYLTTDNLSVVVRGNIISQGASHGLQMRAGGVVEDNLFVRNGIGLSFGLVNGVPTLPGGVTGTVQDNVILEGEDIDINPRGMGMELGNIHPVQGATVSGNILRDVAAPGINNFALYLNGTNGEGVNGLTIRDNIIYNWPQAFRFDGDAGPGQGINDVIIKDNDIQGFDLDKPLLVFNNSYTAGPITFSGNRYHSARAADEWFRIFGGDYSLADWMTAVQELDAIGGEILYPDPTRSLATYSVQQGGLFSFQGFINLARQQSKQNWKPAMQAGAVNNWIREGFALSMGMPALRAPQFTDLPRRAR